MPQDSELRRKCANLNCGGTDPRSDEERRDAMCYKTDADIWTAARNRDEYVAGLRESEQNARRIRLRTGEGDPATATGVYFSYAFMKLPYWSEELVVPDPMHTTANEVRCHHFQSFHHSA